MRLPSYVILSGLVAALQFTGLLMFEPLVSLVLSARGMPHSLIGAVVSAFALIPLFLAIPMGSLVDRFGARPFILFGGLALPAAILMVVAWPVLAVFVLSQVLAGTAQLAVIVATQTLTSRVNVRALRDHALGIYTTFVSIGQLVGPPPGGALYDAYGYRVAFLAAAVVSFAPALLARAFPARGDLPGEGGAGALPDPIPAGGNASLEAAATGQAPVASVREPLVRLLRLPGVRLAILTSFGLIFTLGVRETFFAIYVKDELGYSATFFAVLLSLRAIAAIAVRTYIPALIRAVGGRHRLATASMAVSALGIGVTPWTRDPVTLVLASLFLGAATGVIQPLSIMAVADSTADETRGRAMGLRLTGNRLAQFASPLVFGTVVGAAGLAAGFIVGGILLAVATALVMRQRHAYVD